jgi:cellulose synthase/poly-beta-1,6-N-acetylglucosamine synthase-like glycosyltransferase
MKQQPTNSRDAPRHDPSRFRGIVEPFVRLPRVSVCIGCFNQSQFIEKAIRSVAAQTYAAFDCVVVDDLSSDESRERIQSCVTDMGDDRFRFIPRPRNGGQMATMMTGSKPRTGHWSLFWTAMTSGIRPFWNATSEPISTGRVLPQYRALTNC